MSQNSKRSGSKKTWIVVLILSLLLLIAALLVFVLLNRWWDRGVDPAKYHTTAPTPEPPVSTAPTEAPVLSSAPGAETGTEAPLPDNPVDFAGLKEINPDVHAWIYIPMGPEKPDIDLPVLQAPPEEDDKYYLHHDINRKYLFAGCIFTQSMNAVDFTDRVSVVYGHNMLDGTMFSNLPCFRDSDFFREHEFFYIYIPGHILTYRIAAAIQFDTRHILNCFDFSDDQVYADWLRDYVMEPKTMIRNVRENLELDLEDKLVILSTCLEHGASRYLIEGVLVSDERTK